MSSATPRPTAAVSRGSLPAVLLLLLLLLLLFAPPAALAQVVTGELAGRVVASDGSPRVGVDVVVSGPELTGTLRGTTDDDGRFRLLRVSPGVYTVRLTRIGLRETVVEGVRVRLGRTAALEALTMDDAAVDLPPIRVRAAMPRIDPVSTDVGAVLEAGDFELLPVERDHRLLAILAPGADQSFYGDDVNVGGATGMENRYFVDGVDVSDPFLGFSGMRLPHNFVQALQVRMGGYQAEHQGALGGAIDVLTRSGGDRWTGQAFGFFAGNRFADVPRRGVTQPELGDFAHYDAGFSLAGPLLAERLGFFGAYNAIVEREEVDVPGLGFFTDRSLRHVMAAKLDWRASPAHRVSLTVTGDPAERDAVGGSLYGAGGVARLVENADAVLGVQNGGGVAVSVSGTHTLGPALLLETSLSRFTHTTRSRPAGRGSPDEPLVRHVLTATLSGGYIERMDERNTRWAMGAKLSWLPPGHTVKIGAGLRDNRLDSDTHSDLLILQAGGTALQGQLDRAGTVHNRVPWAFVQDSWRIHDRLVLNAGLRWEGEWLIDGRGRVAQSIPDELQPRVGFVLLPEGRGTDRIAGSWGRYYHELSAYVVQRHFSGVGSEMQIRHDGDPRAGPTVADTVVVLAAQPEADLRGQYEDAFSLEYERELGGDVVVGAQWVYRTLGQAIENGAVAEAGGDVLLGNPGRGVLREYPRAWRQYRALTLSVAREGGERLNARASYTWSRNEGNHAGIYNAYGKWSFPLNSHYDRPDLLRNAEGLLPNDRTHVLKLAGSYRTGFGLDSGLFFTWQSGTPLSDTCCGLNLFLAPRGSGGRTPAIADLDLRLAYDLDALSPLPGRTRVLLDLFNIGSGGMVVDIDQRRFQGPAPSTARPNPFWGSALRYHPPFAVRVGVETAF